MFLPLASRSQEHSQATVLTCSLIALRAALYLVTTSKPIRVASEHSALVG